MYITIGDVNSFFKTNWWCNIGINIKLSYFINEYSTGSAYVLYEQRNTPVKALINFKFTLRVAFYLNLFSIPKTRSLFTHSIYMNIHLREWYAESFHFIEFLVDVFINVKINIPIIFFFTPATNS